MSQFEVGDIVVTNYPGWEGCSFEITSIEAYPTFISPVIVGKIIKSPPLAATSLASTGRAAFYVPGQIIRWSKPDALKLATASSVKDEKYYSPFTGKWT